VLLCDLRHGTPLLHHGIEGKERRLPISFTTPSCFFISISLFSSFMWEGIGCTGVTSNFIALRCNNQEGKASRQKSAVKRSYASSDSLYDVPFTSRDTTTVYEMGPTVVMGSSKAQRSKAKPDELGQSYPEQPERGTK
jgi:hypothetical protein